MTPEDKQFWTAAVPTIGGVLYALIPLVRQWLHQRALERASLRKDAELVRALEASRQASNNLPPGGGAVLLLVAMASAMISLYGGDPEWAAAAPMRRKCSSSAECDRAKGERCEGGICVNTAKRGAQPPLPAPAPSADWAMHHFAPWEETDPRLGIFEARALLAAGSAPR